MNAAKILIVDDEPSIRSFLGRVLEREGYRVQAAVDGYEALQQLDHDSFDLLLTDIRMDRLDGVGLLQEARVRHPQVAVILLTGHATVDSAVAALQHGAYNYLLKPVKNQELVEAVGAALQARERNRRRDRLEQIAAQILETVQPENAVNKQVVQPESPDIQYAGLRLRASNYTVTLDGSRLDLTPTEFRLLQTLTREPGTVLDYVTLVEYACGYSCTRQEAQEIIGTHIRNLRQKMGVEVTHPLYIEAVRGLGYRVIANSDDL